MIGCWTSSQAARAPSAPTKLRRGQPRVATIARIRAALLASTARRCFRSARSGGQLLFSDALVEAWMAGQALPDVLVCRGQVQ